MRPAADANETKREEATHRGGTARVMLHCFSRVEQATARPIWPRPRRAIVGVPVRRAVAYCLSR